MTAADRKATARRLTQAKRIVVKVGSALLVDGDSGRLNRSWLESLAVDVAGMRRRGQFIRTRVPPVRRHDVERNRPGFVFETNRNASHR